MKKYEVPVMKLHQLKAGSILQSSAKPSPNAGGASTQSYEYEGGFNGDNLYED